MSRTLNGNNQFDTFPGWRCKGSFAAGSLIAGHYRVKRIAGEGSSGVVYECSDLENGEQLVAVKVFSSPVFEHEGDFKKYRERIERLSQQGHPNIVKCFCCGKIPETGEKYMVMELAGYTSFRPLLQLGVPQDQILSVVREIASALDHIHHLGFVHGDVKPENVVMGTDGHVKLLDIVLLGFEEKEEAACCSGTPAYRAPELWLGGRASAASDQYALALMVYEMLSGTLPFTNREQGDPDQIFLNNKRLAGNGKYSKAFQVLEKALDKAPLRRFGNCSEFSEALEKALMPVERQKRPCLFWGGILLCFLIAAAFFAIFDSRCKLSVPGAAPAPVSAPVSAPAPAPAPASAWALKEEKLKLKVSTGRKNNVFYGGEKLELTVIANKACYLLVFVRQSDGSEVVLFPNYYNNNIKIMPDEPVRIPGSNRRGFCIVVSPPWGKDVIHVVGSTRMEDAFSRIAGMVRQERRSFVQTKGLQIMSEELPGEAERELVEIKVPIETRKGHGQ